MSPGDEVRQLMAPLFQQAIQEKKWFMSNYQGILMSPAELKKAHGEGRFLWGPVNWKLVDPPSPKSIQLELARLERENRELQTRLNNGWSI